MLKQLLRRWLGIEEDLVDIRKKLTVPQSTANITAIEGYLKEIVKHPKGSPKYMAYLKRLNLLGYRYRE